MHKPPLKTQSGASLIEILVAVSLGLIVMVTSGPLLIHILKQQTAAQQRLEETEAIRFASQVISQHIRDANKVCMNKQDKTRILISTKSEIESELWCMQQRSNDDLEIVYEPNSRSLSCGKKGGAKQVMVDKLWDLNFEVYLADERNNFCADGFVEAIAVLTTLTSSNEAKREYPLKIQWVTAVRQAHWNNILGRSNNGSFESR